MKNIKLKHFAVALMMILQWSCATNESLINAKDDSAVSGNSTQFDIIPKMNYIVDGQETIDRTLITNSQKTAWDVHFDFPKNKVFISTTEKEFNRHVNSDEEFKKNLEENTRNAVLDQSSASSLRVNELASDFSNTGFFNVAYRPSGQSAKHFSFRATNNIDISTYGQASWETTGLYTTVRVATKILYVSRKNYDYQITLRNPKESGNISKTFFKSPGYQGTKVTYTVGPNSFQNIGASWQIGSYQ